MKYCEKCGRTTLKGKPYCWYHDPDTTEAEKQAARSKGGTNSRKRPHNLIVDDCLPIKNSSDLERFYNQLLEQAITNELDTGRMIRLALPIAGRLGDVFSQQILETLSERLAVIEARQAGQLIDGDNGHLLGAGSDGYTND